MKRPISFALTLFLTSVHAIGSLLGVDHPDVVPDSYIVVFKNDISNDALSSHRKQTDELLSQTGDFQRSDFDIGSFRGYHLRASKSVAERLAESDEVGPRLSFGIVAVHGQLGAH